MSFMPRGVTPLLQVGCAEIELAHAQLNERGLKSGPLQVTPYGIKTFEVLDPDGYRLVFQEVAPQD